MKDTKNKNQSPSSRSRRSVKFNLDKNSICKYDSAYSSSKDWYSSAQILSFYEGTARTAMACRKILMTLRKLQERSKQHDFLAGALRLQHQEDDVLCIHGIEHLVVSDSLRMCLVSASRNSSLVVYRPAHLTYRCCFDDRQRNLRNSK